MNASSRVNSRVLAAEDLARGGIQAQRARLEHGRPRALAATGERAQPRGQLRERERLGHVVVGSTVEPANAVLDRIARGEHQHGHPLRALAQAPAGLDAVHARQHHVQHDRLVLDRAHAGERLVAVGGDVDHQALVAQAAPDGRRHPRVVLDHEHSHVPPNDEPAAERPLRTRGPYSWWGCSTPSQRSSRARWPACVSAAP
jgi:hypothetical protein